VTDAIFLHQPEKLCLESFLEDGLCCAVVGLSNTGKSVLLRDLCATGNLPVRGTVASPIYVDCNQMVDLSEQGFYEVVLRTVRSRLSGVEGMEGLQEVLERAYRRVVEPANPFVIPVAFAEGMERLCDRMDRPVVVVLDEFDEPFATLEGRVFLNLRALRDRYGSKLVYVVGVERPLGEIRPGEETVEFRELFAGHLCRVGMDPGPQVARWIREMGEEEGIELSEEEVAFVLAQAGGHPGLVRAITRLLLRAKMLAPETYGRMGTALVAEAVPGDPVVLAENERLWSCLTEGEQRTVERLASGGGVGEAALDRLRRLGLVDEEGRFFGEAFADFVRRRRAQRDGFPKGVWLDERAGEAYVDGHRVPMLTDLEFRLLKALYGRKGQLCDRYYLVEQVWGEAYIGEVDNARIEKLISRLRSKIEPEPSQPRYLLTVRGRGYRLVDGDEESSG